MRRPLGSYVGIILIIIVGISLSTGTAEARVWGNADDGWGYSVAQTCRDGISFGLANFNKYAINLEAKVGASIVAQHRMTLLDQPINLDPDLTKDRQATGLYPFSGVFTVPWSSALSPSTVVSLQFFRLDANGGRIGRWVPEQTYVVADCYLPDLSLTVTGSPDPVGINNTLKYTLNVTNPSPRALVTETARDAFPSNFASITIPASGNGPGSADPYPSEIAVAGLTGSVSGITVTLTSLQHINPDDLDILLVGPRGQKVLLMSDAGGGFGFSFVDLVFDDAAPAALPDNGQIGSGTYKASNYPDGTDSFPTPAPAGPYGATLADFKGTDPNGIWKLFVYDDRPDNDGSLADWKLTISTTTRAATVVNTLPVGTTFVSATGTGWSCSRVTRTVTCIRNSLARGVVPPITITARAPGATGSLTNRATVAGSRPDPKLANNTATVSTLVSRGVYLPLVIR